MNPSIRRPRGFTLVELMVGFAVGAIVLGAIAASIIAMNGVFQANSVTKSTVEAGRASLSFLERTLPRAGYGIPPQFAFDFQVGGTAPAAMTTKDNQVMTGFVTDDLAYRWRDPNYLRMGNVNSGSNSVTLTGADTFGMPLKAGQALMVSCVGSAEQFLMVRTTAPAIATDNTVAVAAYGAPFPTFNDPCLQGPEVFVMLLNEARVRIVALTGGRPFLIVNHNMLDLADFDVLAPDVENFQVAYVMNQPNPSISPAPAVVDASSPTPNWVFGDEIGAPSPDYPNAGLPAPRYKDPYVSPVRFNANPANIRAIRIAVTLKSQRPMPNQQSGAFARENIGNYAVSGPIDSFYRLTLTTQAQTPNMASRGLMTPSLANLTDPNDRRNKWGG